MAWLVVIVLTGSYILFRCYEYGLFYPIEAAYSSPDGGITVELVERDFFLNTGEGYMVRFHFDGARGGINRYFTDWDQVQPHWAPDSVHVMLEIVTTDGNREIRIVDTSEHTRKGGTWEIPDMTADLVPILTSLCAAHPDFPTGWERVTFTFQSWHSDSESATFSYETDTGETGTLAFQYSTETIASIQ